MTADVKQNPDRDMMVELPSLFRISVAGIELIAVILLAIISGNLVLFLLEKYGASEISTEIYQPVTSSASINADNDFVYLKSIDAFYPRNPVVNETQAAQLPESTLDVQIFGIRASGNGNGTVILKSQGSVQQLARVGSEIAPNTILTAINPDRIEFRRGGRLETIYLDKERTVSSLANHHQPALRTDAETSAYTISLFVEALNLSPYRNGRSISGFTVGSQADSTLLALSGLKVGDIITDVNGNELHSWERVSEIPDEASSGKLDVQLERHGEPLNISISTSSMGQ